MVDAVISAARLRINPGGQVLGMPVRDISSTPERTRERLLTKSQCEELDDILEGNT